MDREVYYVFRHGKATPEECLNDRFETSMEALEAAEAYRESHLRSYGWSNKVTVVRVTEEILPSI